VKVYRDSIFCAVYPLQIINTEMGKKEEKIINILTENSTAKTYIGEVVMIDCLVSCCRQV